MVDVETMSEMEKHYDNNLKRYIKKHPGEFVLIEGTIPPFSETFFKSSAELNKATRKYEGMYGPYYLNKKIPLNMHGFEKREPKLEFIKKNKDGSMILKPVIVGKNKYSTLDVKVNEEVKLCPNDKETKLKYKGEYIVSETKNGKNIWRDVYFCPTCDCRVTQKLKRSRVKELEESLDFPIG